MTNFAAPIADRIATLGWQMTVLGALVAAGVFGLLAAGLRRRHPASSDGSPNKLLVVGGLVMPIVVVSVVFGLSLAAGTEIPHAGGDDALIVEVEGRQFWWEIKYPDAGVVTANEIHIPVDRNIEFRLSSIDVIHSMWVPQLGGKMDALPDYENTLVLRADEPGTYRGVCSEFCGLGHAHMNLTVVAHRPVDFEDWIDRNAADVDPTELPAEGAQVFADADCGSCHTIRGTVHDGDDGPDLTHLADRERIGGGVASTEPSPLEAWLVAPHELKPGTEMPAAELDDAQLAALIDYLLELR